MNSEAIVGLIHNTALLLGLAVVYDNLPQNKSTNPRLTQLITGVMLGLIGLAVMFTPWEFSPGIIFDTRSILLSLTGLFFGSVPALIVVVMTAVLRLFQGGAGAWTGVAVIVFSGILGIAWRRYRVWRQQPLNWLELYLFGIVVHLTMLLWMLTLPGRLEIEVLRTISIPVMGIYPIGTVLLGRLLVRQQKRKENEFVILQSEERLRQIVQNMPVMLDAIDEENNIIVWNAECERVTGYKADEIIGNPRALELLYPNEAQREKMLAESGERLNYFRNLEWPITCKDGTIKTISWSNISSQVVVPGWYTWAVGINVTERQQALQRAQDSEERYRLLVDQSPYGIAVHQDGQVVFANQAALRLMKASSEEDLIGKSIDEMVAPEGLEAARNRIGRMLTGETGLYPTEDQYICLDGSVVPVEVTAAPFLHKGKTAIQVIALDVTERKRAEEKQAEAETRFKRALENIPDVIVIYDADLRIQFINEATRQITGRPVSDFIGKREDEIWPPEIYESYLPSLKKAFSTGETQSLETELNLPDGGVRYLQITCVPVLNEKGEVREVVGVTHDYTERRQMQEIIRQREHFLSAIVDTSPALIYVYDMQTQGNVYANDGIERALGYSSEEVQTMGVDLFERLIHPDDLAAVGAFQAEIAAATSDVVLEIEYRMRHADNGWRILRSYERPFLRNKDGSLKQKIGIAIDVTQSREAEQALRESEELFSNAFHVGPAAMAISHIADGKFINVNDSFLDLFGYGREEVINKTSIELNILTPEARQALIQRQIESGGLRNAEFLAQTKSGQAIHLLFSSHPIEIERQACLITTIIDISKLKQTEQALRQSERILRLFVEHAPAAIAMFDTEMNYIAASRRYAADYRLDDPELSGRSHYEVFTEIPERWKEIHRRCLAGASEMADKDPFPRADGSLDWIRWKLHPWYEGNGEIGGLLLFSEVITERVQAEIALRESQERFRTAFENSASGMCLTGLDGILFQVNQSFCNMLGYSKEELEGEHFNAFTYADDIHIGKDMMKNMIAGGVDSATFEKRYLHKSGKPIWAHINSALLQDASGNSQYFITQIEDVTARKRAEEALQRYTQRLAILRQIDRDIVRTQLPELIIGSTLENLRKLIPCWRASVGLFDHDDAAALIFAVSSEEPTTPASGARISLAATPLIEELKSGKTLVLPDLQSIEVPTSQAGQRYIQAGVRSVLAVPLMVDEQLVGSVSLLDKRPYCFTNEHQEIVEEVANQLAIALRQHQLREEIQAHNEELETRVRQRTAELETVNQELETFTYSVSHDLKAPLRGIDGYSQLLLEDYGNVLDEDGRLFLQKVRQAAGQMHQLIEDLLAYSRLERRSVHAQQVNIHALVNALVNEYIADVDSDNTAVELNIPFDTITADQDGLAVALRNLIENAFKFTRNVAEPRILIGGQETEHSCILWVEDNGIGFDMAYQERIFEIFQRLHRSERYPGTGIGLAMVRKAMTRLDGKTWAESEPGQGAKFYLELPKIS